MRVIFSLSFFVIAAVSVTCVQAVEDNDKLSKYFTSGDQYVQAKNILDFEAAVPDSSRLNALAKILESTDNSREGQVIQTQIVGYLIIRKLYAWKDHAELHAMIIERAHGELQIRRMVFDLICDSFTGETKRALVMTFLGDLNDNVRGDAITQISRLDDGQKILEGYVRQHEKKEQYAASVKRAKGWLERRERNKQKQIPKTPTTLKSRVNDDYFA